MVITPVTSFPELAAASTLPMPQTGGADFGRLLGDGLSALHQQTNAASEALAAYAVGSGGSTHELLIAMEQAKLSMQLAVEVRNRLLEAYQELSRLQI